MSIAEEVKKSKLPYARLAKRLTLCSLLSTAFYVAVGERLMEHLSATYQIPRPILTVSHDAEGNEHNGIMLNTEPSITIVSSYSELEILCKDRDGMNGIVQWGIFNTDDPNTDYLVATGTTIFPAKLQTLAFRFSHTFPPGDYSIVIRYADGKGLNTSAAAYFTVSGIKPSFRA